MEKYSTAALKRGVENAKKNIVIFEEAIEKEKKNIKEYRYMIKTLNRKKREMEKSKIIVEG
ncbi:MAG: hypothetical protein DRO89_05005 [Candidatus Altiarchaeales archaeon]|nr:MAG: hypothetical protein DRO89_05005 [Candidatus Altiarchaeales archaeon]